MTDTQSEETLSEMSQDLDVNLPFVIQEMLAEPTADLQDQRLVYKPPLPNCLKALNRAHLVVSKDTMSEQSPALVHSLKNFFSATFGHPVYDLVQGEPVAEPQALNIGVVLSGGPAPGGHNVISGIFDAMAALNPNGKLVGFLDGPGGVMKNRYVILTQGKIDAYRNTGGFDIIGSGRDKIKTQSNLDAALNSCNHHELDGLVVIGGDDSNTNAAFLAEYFAYRKSRCKVVGVPKTIDGDLANEFVETSFGFDTATKFFAHEVGNLMRDAISARKYWFMIKMMGRDACHITLEVAMQTRPNVAIISEEIKSKGWFLTDVVSYIADVVVARAKQGKNYGVVLIPEGLLLFVPDVQKLIATLNRVLSTEPHSMVLKVLRKKDHKVEYVEGLLSGADLECFRSLPLETKVQLLEDRDSHGNVQVSKIDTDQMLGEMIEEELIKRKKANRYGGSFNRCHLFCGYQGRCDYPSNFDSNYCYALGHVAVVLLQNKLTGFMATLQKLNGPVEQWTAKAVPLTAMMGIEERHGRNTAVISKALVDLNSNKFKLYKAFRQSWEEQDAYRFPGPVQFYGPKNVADSVTYHLRCRM